MELSDFPLSSGEVRTGSHKSVTQMETSSHSCFFIGGWEKNVYQPMSGVHLDPLLDSDEKSHFVNGHIDSSRTACWDSLHPQKKPSWQKWPWIAASRPFFGRLASIVNSHGLSGIILRPDTEQYAYSFALCLFKKVTSIHFNIQKYIWEIKVLTEIDQFLLR